jgi:non-homologous end joining protein Ku
VTGEVVRPGELVKGYEFARNEVAAIDPQEIKAAEVETSYCRILSEIKQTEWCSVA